MPLLSSAAFTLNDYLTSDNMFTLPDEDEEVYKNFLQSLGRPTGNYPSKIFQQYVFFAFLFSSGVIAYDSSLLDNDHLEEVTL